MNKYRTATTIFAIILCIQMTIGSIPGWGMTILDEEKLSEKFMREATKYFTFIDDPVIVRYIAAIGNRIVKVLPRHPYQFRFYAIKEDSYNAFAGPGGVVFINSGLLAAMETPGELAGILGHEIIHVYSRHISDRIDRSKQIGIVTLAGLVAAIALGAAGVGAAANAMAIGSVAAGQSLALSYSREDELQADQLGLKILVKAGYHPAGLVSILNKIRKKQWVDTNQFPTYLRTHPAAEDRVAYINAWIDRQKNLPALLSSENNAEFEWIRERVSALYGDKNVVLTQYAGNIKKAPNDPLANYGYGLILARIGHYQEAARYLRKALAKRAFDADLLIDLGRVYFLDGRFNAASDTLAGALGIDSDNIDGRYYMGRTHLALKEIPEAVAIFKALLKTDPAHRDLIYFASQAYGQQGNMKEAYYYLGRHYYRQGRAKQAIAQLKKALGLTDNVERKEEIQAMLKELRGEVARRRSSNDQ
jgi:predicted Zn-dependent protease